MHRPPIYSTLAAVNKPTSASDSIAAAATAAGKAGIGVVRVSGSLAAAIGDAVLGGLPSPRAAALREFRDADGVAIDSGIALYFPGPHSYTGEDVLELQGHGSPVVIDALLKRVCALGARPARPGEFTERAFLNDKLDLAQAEAVADLIDSGSVQAARAAMRSLQGEFSLAVHELTSLVTALRIHVEAAIDFPEEEIDFLSDEALARRVAGTAAAFDTLQRQVRAGRALTDGLSIVLAGEPNVGKSSLLNALVGDEAAIVTDIAGTTRDLIREQIVIDGLPVTLVDTAGLRDSEDVVEREGVRRTRKAVAEADHALLLVDARESSPAAQVQALLKGLPEGLACTVVANKIDLSGHAAGSETIDVGGSPVPLLWLSARSRAGIDALRSHLCDIAGLEGGQEGTYSARRRHLLLLEEAREAFDAAVVRLRVDKAGELMAEELRLCQVALGGITGEFSSDDLLGRIFGEFCIGK